MEVTGRFFGASAPPKGGPPLPPVPPLPDPWAGLLPTPMPPTTISKAVLYVQWQAEAGACPVCVDNADVGWVPDGYVFPSGDTEPPAHANCRCTLSNWDMNEFDYELDTNAPPPDAPPVPPGPQK